MKKIKNKESKRDRLEPLTIALPKGKLLEPSIRLFSKIGIKADGNLKKTRRLIFDAPKSNVKFLIVRATDVPTYVEYGAADIGIVGKDVLMEQGKDVYEPVDLKYGYCQIIIAKPEKEELFKGREGLSRLRIATKYPNITERYFSQKGAQAEIIKLYGSIELAPLTGLSDRIVDLISTGQTLKENGLVVVERVAESTARLIVNRASMKIKYKRIKEMVEDIKKAIAR
ncbi:MAG: ATP phosphoribosyltransferase [Nitrospirae bacterium RBG_19FT_COMBO_42_15]|nr:MAG: ATP phosphoribosyltransferase [Nitrospirae bacterium RBG_19FT_COMBO_42_15]